MILIGDLNGYVDALLSSEKSNSTLPNKNLMPTSKHGKDCVIVWHTLLPEEGNDLT